MIAVLFLQKNTFYWRINYNFKCFFLLFIALFCACRGFYAERHLKLDLACWGYFAREITLYEFPIASYFSISQYDQCCWPDRTFWLDKCYLKMQPCKYVGIRYKNSWPMRGGILINSHLSLVRHCWISLDKRRVK